MMQKSSNYPRVYTSLAPQMRDINAKLSSAESCRLPHASRDSDRLVPLSFSVDGRCLTVFRLTRRQQAVVNVTINQLHPLLGGVNLDALDPHPVQQYCFTTSGAVSAVGRWSSPTYLRTRGLS
ncbi:hypothetical protein LMG9964_02236 [Paraburkholderia phenoliruptrix]|uniref:Uncharacterized protein n=1 Tax=Paraburkholderia phenoliruptrix TaxID=252970 RepID=A0A6J5K6P1_9BURK|nr:hypothetical protein LMG9964_02236 [Paraburkholderia phenoliruptrix]